MRMVEPAGGSRVRAARAIRSFSAVFARVALDEAGLDDRQAVGRHRAAVHPADQAHPFQGGEVAAHRFGGDGVLLGEYVHRQTPALGHELGHRLLAFLGVQGHRRPPSLSVESVYMLFYARMC